MAEPDAQSTDASGADVWVGRAAMLAFTAVLTTEIVSGKGVFTVRPCSGPLASHPRCCTASLQFVR